MTKQQLMQRTYNLLLAQGGPSASDAPWNGPTGGICLYRGDGGRRCAAGWWVPNLLYTKDMETKRVHRLFIMDGLRGWLLRLWWRVHGIEVNFLDDMQGAHDLAARDQHYGMAWKDALKTRFGRLAQQHNLEAPR